MNDNKPTIDDLFSDNGAFDESEVVKAIQPFVTIQKSTNEIFLRESGLSNEKKILVYGLAKKLLHIKGLIENEMVSAVEVHKKTGIKKGSIDPAFKKLKEEGLFLGKGSSEIPNMKISQIIKLLSQK